MSKELSKEQTVELRNKLNAVLMHYVLAEKPIDMKPSENSYVEGLIKQLIKEPNLGLTAQLGYGTIAEEWLGLSRKSRQQAEVVAERVAARRWVLIKSGKSQYISSSHTLNIHNLPQASRKTAKQIVSLSAERIAEHYLKLCKLQPKYPSKKKNGRSVSVYRKQASHQLLWQRIAQSWLDHRFTEAQVIRMIEYGIQHVNKAGKGMQVLVKKFEWLQKKTNILPNTPDVEPEITVKLPMEAA
jgi:hypothetical protein